TLAHDVSTELLLDFDGQASVVETGNGTYILRPVVSVKDRRDHRRGASEDAGNHPGGPDGGGRRRRPGGRRGGEPDGGMAKDARVGEPADAGIDRLDAGPASHTSGGTTHGRDAG